MMIPTRFSDIYYIDILKAALTLTLYISLLINDFNIPLQYKLQGCKFTPLQYKLQGLQYYMQGYLDHSNS
jgi:hypothetical protein